MYILSELAITAQDDKLRLAARRQMSSQAHAARRDSRDSRGVPARRAAGMRILRVLRGRRAAQAY